MVTHAVSNAIRLKGVRQNNLKNFDCELPLGKLIVVTGLSGSGKSSFAFDTLYAEGQRRYIETFSPYARQFFDRMDKPLVDRIDGIPPAIAIEQKNTVKTTRSTVGTMTELTDFMKLLWPHISQLYCSRCDRPVLRESPLQVWETSIQEMPGAEVAIAFRVPRTEKLSWNEATGLIESQGYQRILVPLSSSRLELHETTVPLSSSFPDQEHRVARLSETEEFESPFFTILQDVVRLEPSRRARFLEGCEQAYHFGKGRLQIYSAGDRAKRERSVHSPRNFSNHFHCAPCDIEYQEPVSALFSFNHPLGACPTCRGFGRVISIDDRLVMPDRSRTLFEGVVKPWRTGQGLESHQDLLKFCKKRKVPVDVPFRELSPEHQKWVIEGDPGYGQDAAHEWPRAWYGVRGYFKWLESKAYKMHVRVLLSRYRSYTECGDCKGTRFQPLSLQYQVRLPGWPALSLSGFYQLPIRDAFRLIVEIKKQQHDPRSAFAVILQEVLNRLGYLEEIGLGYLTLDRPSRTLSGGETERVNLTTCLGSRLVNTLYVLDEPSVGLHPADTERLVKILQALRDLGNTVLVVEHEAGVMRGADQILDLGPGQGERGGEIVFQGSFNELPGAERSLTAAYLTGRKVIPVPQRRPVNETTRRMEIKGASIHNLENLSVAIPLQRLVCITGVSGSGKSTLLRDVLLPLLRSKLNREEDLENPTPEAEESETARPSAGWLSGSDAFSNVVVVDQSPLGKTPRSTPAVYIGAFDGIRGLFAHSPEAKAQGYKASSFSFNSKEGQCEQCRGAGFEKIEMQFLSDIFIRCSGCNGRRYRAHLLEVQWNYKSIADVLEMTTEEALGFLGYFPEFKESRQAAARLHWLKEVGLGYLRLGQPINTLSGGEIQRVKLAAHLADEDQSGKTLFLFDEPTTGLHFEDVRILIDVFQRLVDRGHSALVIEHHLDVIKSADWVLDLGPGAGDQGGQLVGEGTPEDLLEMTESATGQALKGVL